MLNCESMNAAREIGVLISVSALLGIGLTFLYFLGTVLPANQPGANTVEIIQNILGNPLYLAVIGLVFIVTLLGWAWSIYNKSQVGQTKGGK